VAMPLCFKTTKAWPFLVIKPEVFNRHPCVGMPYDRDYFISLAIIARL